MANFLEVLDSQSCFCNVDKSLLKKKILPYLNAHRENISSKLFINFKARIEPRLRVKLEDLEGSFNHDDLLKLCEILVYQRNFETLYPIHQANSWCLGSASHIFVDEDYKTDYYRYEKQKRRFGR